MARIHGLGSISTNFELSLRRPLDARMLVSKKEDLINPDSWTLYTFNGMIVAVGSDPEASNNGIYILKDRSNITTYEAWSKVAELGDLESLETRISALESIEIPENIVTAEELEAALQQIRNEMAEIDLSLYATKDELSAKQDKLTAGDNITISEDGVISAAVSEQYDDSEIRSLIDSNTQGLSTLQSQLDSIPNEYIDNDELSAVENKLRAEIEEGLKNKVDLVDGKELSTNDYTNEEKEKLASLENYDDSNLVKKIEEVESKIPSLENYYTEEEVNNLLLNKADKSELFSGDYNDLINKPEIPSVDGLASEQYVQDQIATIEIPDISNKADRSELFSGDYNDLTNKPEIPSVEGLATETFVINKIAEAELNDKEVDLTGYATKDDLLTKADKEHTHEQYLVVEDLNDYAKSSDIPSTEGLASEEWVNNQGFLKEHQDISHLETKEDSSLKLQEAKDYTDTQIGLINIPSIEGLATEQYVKDQIGLIEIPDVSNKADKSELFSGDYNDLTNKPEIPSIDGLASEQYVQDQIGLIEIPDISGKADKSELGNYYTKEESNQLLEEKANKSELFSKDYNDLINKPEIPSVEGFATTQWVEEQQYLKEHQDISGKLDISVYETDKQKTDEKFAGYVTKEELENENYSTFDGDYNSLINKPDIPSIEGLATEEYVQEQVSSKVDTKELESYYGKSEVDSLLQNKADSSSVYTKEEVDQKIENIDIPEMPTNWNADEVFFEQDLIFTEGFGKYVPDNSGSVKILTKTNNMSLQDLLLSAFSEEKDPVTTQPTISLKSSNIGSKEVGTKISVQYNFADETTGSYSYGPDTGVIWSDYSATFNGQTVEGISGTFEEVQVTDNTSLVINGSAKHSSGSTPKTNLGNDFVPEEITDELGAIQEKTISVQKGTLSGYRKMFFGTMSEKVDITSDIIRGLATSQAVAKVSDKEFTIPVGAMRVVLAVPSTYSVSKCLDVNGFNTDLIATGGMLGPIAVSVEGANNYNAIVYDVYYQDYANANDTVNTYKVTVVKD